MSYFVDQLGNTLRVEIVASPVVRPTRSPARAEAAVHEAPSRDHSGRRKILRVRSYGIGSAQDVRTAMSR
jgi:hypothetical protein